MHLKQHKKICGVILAGGKGTRLYPLTHVISKQLLPVYKRPMIYYPIGTLIEMGITDIMVIVDPDQRELFERALWHLPHHINIVIEVQKEPRGLPEAFIIAEKWLDGNDVALILGDNIIVNSAPINPVKNSIFTFPVQHPERYGVVVTDELGNIKNIVEKPKEFVSNEAVVGLYIFDNIACKLARNLKPSQRGELEIVDLIVAINELCYPIKVNKLDGFWFDAGNHDDLLDCANFIKALETRSTKKLSL